MANGPVHDLPLGELARYARHAIDLAGALDRTPVPLSEVEQAVGLRPHQPLWIPDKDAPPAIRKIMGKLRGAGKILGGLALPEKRVYLAPDLPHARRRYVHGHEIGHKVLPWHREAYWADNETTLIPEARDRMEAEANAFAAELLFAGDHFTRRIASYAPSIGVPLSMTGDYAVSAHAAMRRYAQVSPHRVALIALGRRTQLGPTGRALPIYFAQCATSAAFSKQYGPISQLLASAHLPLATNPVLQALTGAPAGTLVEDVGDFPLETRRGLITFHTDGFTNGRLNFVIIHKRNALSGRRLRIA